MAQSWAEFGIVARLYFCGEQLGVFESSAAGTLGGQAQETLKFAGTRLFVESARAKRRRRICLKLCEKSMTFAV